MKAERRTIAEQAAHYNEDRGRHPVHDVINKAEELARYLRVMTGGELTLAVVRNIRPADEKAGMHERLRVAEERQGIPWGEAQEEAARIVKVYDDAAKLAGEEG